MTSAGVEESWTVHSLLGWRLLSTLKKQAVLRYTLEYSDFWKEYEQFCACDLLDPAEGAAWLLEVTWNTAGTQASLLGRSGFRVAPKTWSPGVHTQLHCSPYSFQSELVEGTVYMCLICYLNWKLSFHTIAFKGPSCRRSKFWWGPKWRGSGSSGRETGVWIEGTFKKFSVTKGKDQIKGS